MNTEAILFQSVMKGGKPFQQLSNLVLNGLSTRDDALNTDSGRLYGSLTFATGTYTLHLYKDSTKLDLVAHATGSAVGSLTISEDNDSGLSGAVNLAQYYADDTSIEAVCFLSKD